MLCCGSSSWTDRHALPFPHPPLSNLRGRSSTLELSMSELATPSTKQANDILYEEGGRIGGVLEIFLFASRKWSDVAKEKEVHKILDLPRIMHRTPDPSAEHVGAVNHRQEARTRLLLLSFHF